MENHESIAKRLYDYALEYKLPAFRELSDDFAQSGPIDIHLLRAQVKLFATDETMRADLKAAEKLGETPLFPCLRLAWLPQNPDSFAVFNKSEGALGRFLAILPEAGELLGRFYGDTGRGMVCQIMSEILYFTADFKKAIECSTVQYERSSDDCAAAMMAAYVLFRCYLVSGEVEKAEDILLKIIKLARSNQDHPACPKLYQTIREWTNLTTGWSGDTPRYHQTPDGHVQPVLEDRTAAIQKGISHLEPVEEPFLAYAAMSYGNDAYTMRGLFMDIFNALYHYRAEQLEQAGAYFNRAYHIGKNSGLVVPFAEYGRQIIPLLNHIAETRPDYSPEWIGKVISLSEDYEHSINAFRAE